MIWFSAAVISLYVEVCSLSDCGARSLVKYAWSAGYCVDQLEISGVDHPRDGTFSNSLL
jgi:hypothetical protein